MKNSFFSRFAPKEPKFFPWLKELSDIAIGTSELLIDNLQKDTADERAACYKLIKELERKADVSANHVTDELSTTFITPFDREDIHELTAAIDDVVDGINSCSKCILIYHPCTIDESGKKLANYIRQAAQCIRRAMDELERIGKKTDMLRQCCSELHDLENEADEVFEMFIYHLFQQKQDAVETIKLKEIMKELERTTDAAEHVGKILRSLMIKYA